MNQNQNSNRPLETKKERWQHICLSSIELEMERAHFSTPSWARALNFKPGCARACFEPDIFILKTFKICALSFFELKWKLGLPNLDLGACLLQAKKSTRAFKPEPRLVPSFTWSPQSKKNIGAKYVQDKGMAHFIKKWLWWWLKWLIWDEPNDYETMRQNHVRLFYDLATIRS